MIEQQVFRHPAAATPFWRTAIRAAAVLSLVLVAAWPAALLYAVAFHLDYASEDADSALALLDDSARGVPTAITADALWRLWMLPTVVPATVLALLPLVLGLWAAMRLQVRTLDLTLALNDDGLSWLGEEGQGASSWSQVRLLVRPLGPISALRLRTPGGELRLPHWFGYERAQSWGVWRRPAHPLMAALGRRVPAAKQRERPSAEAWLLILGFAGCVGARLGVPSLDRARAVRQALAASAYLARGDAAAAERAAESLTQRRPAFVGGWLVLAEAQGRQGDLAAALTALERAYALAPDSSHLPRRIADILIQGDDYGAAVPWMIRAGPGYPGLDTARALLAAGDYARASRAAARTTKKSDAAYGEVILRIVAEMMAGDADTARRLFTKLWLPPVPGPILGLKVATLRRCLGLETPSLELISPGSEWHTESTACRLFELQRCYWTEGLAAGDRLAAPLVAAHPYLRLSIEEDRAIARLCADSRGAP